MIWSILYKWQKELKLQDYNSCLIFITVIIRRTQRNSINLQNRIGLDAKQSNEALYKFTKNVLIACKAQGTLPDMVQVGNEINHGIVWPDPHISKLDTSSQLLNAGIEQ